MTIERLRTDFVKFRKAVATFLNSVARLPPLPSSIIEDPVAMEPYDALSSRFERCVEVFLGKYLRSLELHVMGAASATIRERLQFGHKIGLLKDVELWLEMREFRNRMPHDYLPEKLGELFEAIRGRFAHEIQSVLTSASAHAGWGG